MIFSMMIAKGESAKLSTELFVVWVIMGAIIYASYGYKKNRKAEALAENKEIADKEVLPFNSCCDKSLSLSEPFNDKTCIS